MACQDGMWKPNGLASELASCLSIVASNADPDPGASMPQFLTGAYVRRTATEDWPVPG